MPETIYIRPATESDFNSIQSIYAHYVLTGLASFEIDPPDCEEMVGRWRIIQDRHHPYLVAEIGGQVAGYAYASVYRNRPAYNHTLENSVYVSTDFQRRGVGRTLLNRLIDLCAVAGFRQMVAVIGDSANDPSINLHKSCGYQQVGLLPSTGFKHGRWVDSVIMQLALGDGDTTPPSSD
jgi:L-amino acid N-acyltransferase YncA